MPDDLIIHDADGWTQRARRALLLAGLEEAQATAAAQGQTLTWTEEPDGVTLFVDGRQDSRVTWAELARAEILAAADPTPAGHAATMQRLEQEFDHAGRPRTPPEEET